MHESKEPIHRAAENGDVEEVERLIAEDPGRLNAQTQGPMWSAHHRTPLMLAAEGGHSAVVARLLALGADTELKDSRAWTALYDAVIFRRPAVVPLLLNAGADLTVRDSGHSTPLDIANLFNDKVIASLLQASIADSECARLLIKARVLLDTCRVHCMLSDHFMRKGLPMELQGHILELAAPLERMVDWLEMPPVEVDEGRRSQVKLVEAIQYTLGLGEYEGKEMANKAFVELMDMIMPKWDRKNL